MEIFGSDRFRKLAAQGARVQRLLWACTSTKNPGYSDVKYMEAIIGPDTVNTAFDERALVEPSICAASRRKLRQSSTTLLR